MTQQPASAFIALAIVFVTGCSNAEIGAHIDSRLRQEILGRWRGTNEMGAATFLFHADGTGEMSLHMKGFTGAFVSAYTLFSGSMTFKWSIENEILDIDMTGFENPAVAQFMNMIDAVNDMTGHKPSRPEPTAGAVRVAGNKMTWRGIEFARLDGS